MQPSKKPKQVSFRCFLFFYLQGLNLHLRLGISHLGDALLDRPYATANQLKLFFAFEVVPEPPNHERQGKDEGENDDPSELVGEEVRSLAQQLVFAVDVLSIHGGEGGVRLHSEESAFCQILEGGGAQVEAVERGQEGVELLGEVEVDEDDERELLYVLNRLVEEVLHPFHKD